MSELDISLDDIKTVAMAGMRGEALEEYAPMIRMALDTAVSASKALEAALDVANSVERTDGLTPEDRAVVDAGYAYKEAEGVLLQALLMFTSQIVGDDVATGKLPKGISIKDLLPE